MERVSEHDEVEAEGVAGIVGDRVVELDRDRAAGAVVLARGVERDEPPASPRGRRGRGGVVGAVPPGHGPRRAAERVGRIAVGASRGDVRRDDAPRVGRLGGDGLRDGLRRLPRLPVRALEAVPAAVRREVGVDAGAVGPGDGREVGPRPGRLRPVVGPRVGAEEGGGVRRRLRREVERRRDVGSVVAEAVDRRAPLRPRGEVVQAVVLAGDVGDRAGHRRIVAVPAVAPGERGGRVRLVPVDHDDHPLRSLADPEPDVVEGERVRKARQKRRERGGVSKSLHLSFLCDQRAKGRGRAGLPSCPSPRHVFRLAPWRLRPGLPPRVAENLVRGGATAVACGSSRLRNSSRIARDSVCRGAEPLRRGLSGRILRERARRCKRVSASDEQEPGWRDGHVGDE